MGAVKVEEDIRKLVSNLTGEELPNISRSSDLIGDLGMDTLDRVEFTMELEKLFDIRLDDEQADKVETVGDSIDLVLQYL